MSWARPGRWAASSCGGYAPTGRQSARWCATPRRPPTWRRPAPSSRSATCAVRRRSTRHSRGSRRWWRRPTPRPPSTAATPRRRSRTATPSWSGVPSGPASPGSCSPACRRHDLDERVPVARTKRRTEQLLAASGLSWLSLRMPPFSEVWLALVGSELPLRGEERTTLGRAYPTLREVPAGHRAHGRAARAHAGAGPGLGPAGVPVGARRRRGPRGGRPARDRDRAGRPRWPRGAVVDRRRPDLRAGARPARAGRQPARRGLRRPLAGAERPSRRPWPVSWV